MESLIEAALAAVGALSLTLFFLLVSVMSLDPGGIETQQ
jgi:hypothetical protein